MSEELSKNQIDALRSKLQSMDEELSKRLTALKADSTQSHSADSSEQAVERENDEVVDQLLTETNDELRQIKHALKLIEQDTYGICEKCGDDINPKRLEAVPYSTLCINCA